MRDIIENSRTSSDSDIKSNPAFRFDVRHARDNIPSDEPYRPEQLKIPEDFAERLPGQQGFPKMRRR